MSNLRWILLFAGFAILLLLYFSGRPKKNRTAGGDYPRSSQNPAPNTVQGAAQGTAQNLGHHPGSRKKRSDQAPGAGLPDESVNSPTGFADHAAEIPGQQPQPGQGYSGVTLDRTQSHLQQDPLMGASSGYPNSRTAGDDGFSASDVFGQLDPADLVRPAGGDTTPPARGSAQGPSGAAGEARAVSGRSIGEKIESFSSKLSPKRKSRVAASAPADAAAGDSKGGDIKVVLLHVVAPAGDLIDGRLLLDVFEQRGYHFGDLNIFHSLHQGQTVFSVAKIVEPGSFDLNDISSFVSPGLVLILQLPGPVSGDVAFEVLISEAHELASALGCRVLDSDRSTLSKQTVQHLRESVYEYMHRQKYFGKVPS